MADIATTPETTETPTTEAPAKPEKAPKADPTKPCFCSSWEITDTSDASGESTWTTGCSLTTKRTFAQGHDARFVSFLVDGHFDGYQIRRIVDGKNVVFATPEDAAVLASPALGEKAKKATENRKAKNDEKNQKAAQRDAEKAAKAAEKKAEAERKAKEKADAKAAKDAEKAAAPKDVQAKVAEGSQEGDAVPVTPEGVVRIKVGRREFDATIDEAGVATYNDEKTGEPQTIERDGYRLLTA